MSVTFTAVDMPEVEVEEECPYYSPVEDCPECKGTGRLKWKVNLHEAQMSNTNFYSIINMLGMELEYCGRMGGKSLEDFRVWISEARDSKEIRASAVRETVRDGNFTFCGQSDERVNEVLTQLEKVIVWAQDNRKDLIWG